VIGVTRSFSGIDIKETMATPRVSTFHLETVVVELAALEDIAQELMDHIAKNLDGASAQSFRTQCDNYIKEGELQLLVEAFIDGLQAVGPSSSVSDMECRFSILFSLARHLLPAVLTVVVPRIAQVVLSLPSKPDENGDEKMRMEVLHNLYTIIDPRSPTRYGVLMTILNFAIETSSFEVLDGTTANDVKELCSAWNSVKVEISLEQQRMLYAKFCDLCEKKRAVNGPTFSSEEMKAEELKEHRFLIKFLETFEGPNVSEEQLATAQKYAARTAVISIKYPLPGDMAVASSLEEHSLAGMKRAAAAVLAAEQQNKVDSAHFSAAPSAVWHFAAIKYLARIPQYKVLSELLHVFSALGLNEYLQFQQGNPKFVAEIGLCDKACLRNMRLLTLASLAANQETVTYDVIARKIQVEQEDVEAWVIKAIVANLIDAKMDQLNRTIVINRGSQRLITTDQWKQVQSKLAEWKKNVRSLLITVQGVRQEQLAAQQS